MNPDLAWKVSILLYGIVHLIDVSSFGVNFPPEAGRINRIATGIGLVIAIAKISFGIFGSTNSIQVMYLASLVWHLGVSCFGFASLIYTKARAGDA